MIEAWGALMISIIRRGMLHLADHHRHPHTTCIVSTPASRNGDDDDTNNRIAPLPIRRYSMVIITRQYTGLAIIVTLLVIMQLLRPVVMMTDGHMTMTATVARRRGCVAARAQTSATKNRRDGVRRLQQQQQQSRRRPCFISDNILYGGKNDFVTNPIRGSTSSRSSPFFASTSSSSIATAGAWTATVATSNVQRQRQRRRRRRESILLGSNAFSSSVVAAAAAPPTAADIRAQHYDDKTHRTDHSTTNNSTNLAPPAALTDFIAKFSPFAIHVLIQPEQAPIAVMDAVEQSLQRHGAAAQQSSSSSTREKARRLLELGSVWYLPADVVQQRSRGGDPSRMGQKPERLFGQATRMLQVGDYLRIHHDPRRFPAVYQYDWSAPYTSSSESSPDVTITNNAGNNNNGTKPGVIVAEDRERGWLVINKPAMVPVHMTVDNCRENVVACLQQARISNIGSSSSSSSSSNEQHDGDDDDDVLDAHHEAITSSTLPYMSPPQRLDQNTSGLLVLATTKPFAKYFATLLKKKTERQRQTQRNGDETNGIMINKGMNDPGRTTSTMAPNGTEDGVHKLYRCLVCLLPPPRAAATGTASAEDGAWSVHGAYAALKEYAETGNVMRHYLEPSIRAPKRFVTEKPEKTTAESATTSREIMNGVNVTYGKRKKCPSSSTWPEGLLRIKAVSDHVYALVGNDVGQDLARALWQEEGSRPHNCCAVVEVQIELLTGLTHQIRGQLSTAGYPVVGDAQYGGAIPLSANHYALSQQQESSTPTLIASEQLALQCSELEFQEPDIITVNDKEDDNRYYEATTPTVTLKASERWKRFKLDRSWWAPLLDRYDKQSKYTDDAETTTLASDIGLTQQQTSSSERRRAKQSVKPPRPDLLPPRVALSPGRNKYVLIRASHPLDHEAPHWFVKSATPKQCGGPFHADVAQDLVDWIIAAGYTSVEVKGGGRILYEPDKHPQRALVYGFSYAYGKGDHKKACSVIDEYWSSADSDGGELVATFDNAGELY